MAEVVANAQYSLARPKSLTMRVVENARRRMFELFLREIKIAPHESLLDVGVTSDQSYNSSNYVEAWYPHKMQITAVGIDDASFLEKIYPGMKFVLADGRALPFPDASYDVVHSSAVLEHVGGDAQQIKFISELTRVARRAVFLTTPDRAFPIEVHSLLPCLHWLPKRTYRWVLQQIGYEFFAREENLNLLWARDVRRQVEAVAPGCGKVTSLRTLGLPSNVLVVILKSAGPGNGEPHGS